MPTHVYEKKLPKRVLIKNQEVEKAHSTIVNQLVLLFKKLPEKFQSTILIDYKYSPERKALELHKLLHPLIWLTLEAEPNMEYNICYAINYSFKGKSVLVRHYKEIVNIITCNTAREFIKECVQHYFYSDDNLDDIARYKLIGNNNYITITDHLEFV